MKKNTRVKSQTGTTGSKPLVSYAYKPHLIGAVIETVMIENSLDETVVAGKMKTSVRNFQRWYRKEYLPMKQTLELSEALDTNLLLHFHPNVKPLPNPLQAELNKQIGYVKHLEEVEKENGRLKTENKSLLDQVDLLTGIIEKRNVR